MYSVNMFDELQDKMPVNEVTEVTIWTWQLVRIT